MLNDLVNHVETHWLFWLIVGPEVLFIPFMACWWIVMGLFCIGYRLFEGEWPDY